MLLRVLLIAALMFIPAVASAADPEPREEVPVDPDDFHRWHFELVFFPMLLEQQIEGPNRDDKLTQDSTFSTAFTFSYAPLEWLEPAIWFQFDVGNVSRTVYGRPDAEGVAAVDRQIDGAFWEMWIAFMARGRLGYGFLELGWAPLMLRMDEVREEDLPNERGESDGIFEGSRAVAFMLAGGGSFPVLDNLDVTLRLQFRIRYLVSRGGEPLADEEETGQMAMYPYMGAHYHF